MSITYDPKLNPKLSSATECLRNTSMKAANISRGLQFSAKISMMLRLWSWQAWDRLTNFTTTFGRSNPTLSHKTRFSSEIVWTVDPEARKAGGCKNSKSMKSLRLEDGVRLLKYYKECLLVQLKVLQNFNHQYCSRLPSQKVKMDPITSQLAAALGRTEQANSQVMICGAPDHGVGSLADPKTPEPNALSPQFAHPASPQGEHGYRRKISWSQSVYQKLLASNNQIQEPISDHNRRSKYSRTP